MKRLFILMTLIAVLMSSCSDKKVMIFCGTHSDDTGVKISMTTVVDP